MFLLLLFLLLCLFLLCVLHHTTYYPQIFHEKNNYIFKHYKLTHIVKEFSSSNGYAFISRYKEKPW